MELALKLCHKVLDYSSVSYTLPILQCPACRKYTNTHSPLTDIVWNGKEQFNWMCNLILIFLQQLFLFDSNHQHLCSVFFCFVLFWACKVLDVIIRIVLQVSIMIPMLQLRLWRYLWLRPHSTKDEATPGMVPHVWEWESMCVCTHILYIHSSTTLILHHILLSCLAISYKNEEVKEGQ